MFYLRDEFIINYFKVIIQKSKPQSCLYQCDRTKASYGKIQLGCQSIRFLLYPGSQQWRFTLAGIVSCQGLLKLILLKHLFF